MKIKCLITLLAALLLTTGCTNASDSFASRPSEVDGENAPPGVSDEYPAFTGLSLSEKVVAEYSTLNNKSQMPQLFCSSGDIIRFSNPADGLRLYSYDGKETKRLTDIAAFSLNYYDNSVYFLSPEYAEKLDVWLLPMQPRSGTLYRYDIEDGTVTKLSDTLMNGLRVDERGIFCSILDEDGITYIYRVDPQSGECERLHRGFGIQHIGDYELITEFVNEDVGLNILMVSDEERVRLLTGVVPFYDCIHQGIYYYRDNNTGLSFHSLNLVNGVANEAVNCTDYTIFDGRMLLVKKDGLYLYTGDDAERITVEPYTVDGQSASKYYEYSIMYLYTANDKLYAVVSYDSGEYSFAQLNISSDAKSASVTMVG